MGAMTDQVFRMRKRPSKSPSTRLLSDQVLQSLQADLDCKCESCRLLRSPVGEAMLKWASGMVRACTQAIQEGADAETSLEITLQGPSVEAFKQGRVGPVHQEQYARFEMTLGTIGIDPQTEGTYRQITPTPDWDAVEEAYEDDPVILELVAWMKKRLE